MAISHRDFLRILPSALEGRGFEVSGDRVAVADGGRGFEIRLAAEGSRSLGAITLPVTEVSFLFSDYEEAEADRIMERLELHYRRGGG